MNTSLQINCSFYAKYAVVPVHMKERSDIYCVGAGKTISEFFVWLLNSLHDLFVQHVLFWG